MILPVPKYTGFVRIIRIWYGNRTSSNDDRIRFNNFFLQNTQGYIRFYYGAGSIKSIGGAIQKWQSWSIEQSFDLNIVSIVRHNLWTIFRITSHSYDFSSIHIHDQSSPANKSASTSYIFYISIQSRLDMTINRKFERITLFRQTDNILGYDRISSIYLYQSRTVDSAKFLIEIVFYSINSLKIFAVIKTIGIL